jgi:hypothetical protein
MRRNSQIYIFPHILFSLLSINSLNRLLNITKRDVDETLEELHAILDIPEDQSRALHLHHPSFCDFLLDEDRCCDSNLQVDETQAHRTLAASCIELMSTSLKQDICGVDSLGVLVTEVESSQVEQCLPLGVMKVPLQRGTPWEFF